MASLNCPIKRQIVRRLRAVAVLVQDGSGITRFDGDPASIEIAASNYGPKGEAHWTYETRSGTQLPWPKVGDAPGARDPLDAMADRSLYLAERFAEMNARAWREAYATVGTLMQNTLEAQAAAMNALANRVANQEETLERQGQQIRETAASIQQGDLDGLVGKVLDLAAAQANKKPAPNGAH